MANPNRVAAGKKAAATMATPAWKRSHAAVKAWRTRRANEQHLAEWGMTWKQAFAQAKAAKLKGLIR